MSVTRARHRTNALSTSSTLLALCRRHQRECITYGNTGSGGAERLAQEPCRRSGGTDTTREHGCVMYVKVRVWDEKMVEEEKK